ncbi:MATE family efflux transporter [Blautia faecis]|uniref:MATE family efflux transporter n=1 Tax=Blautia faecis TaxID=871665 RepID=UPI00156D44DD|nr:MATE family efflux transporter [Blautia faecis]NSG91262.1 MATE family efflux transporter [Blautia faecis]NSG93373.1 MATE family efflux transporter [Blautia faecis]
MTKNLTTGKIMPILVNFTVPLVLGNLFQLTYNAVDSIIVGHFVGKEALAAVGICNPVSTLMILFLNGLCMGASILMGIQYGAKDYETLHRQISTTLLSGAVFSFFLTLVCVIFAVPILLLLQVDPSIMDMTVQYLRIIFLGLMFTFLYNFFSSTLRALGDSASPLYFLIISAILNIFGDLFFVIVLKAGSNGCAISTVLSEALCCLFCIIYIQKKVPILRLGKKWLVFDARLLKKTIAYGWASAMQQATVQMGKIAIQALVNTMGVSVAAAFAVVNRIDDFAITPEQNIAHAMTALMAQNKGAGKNDRMREGFRCGMILELVYGAAVMLICLGFARPLMSLFVKDEEVIGHGVVYLHLIAVMYILPAITNSLQGFFRGIGDLKVTLMSSFTNMTVRVIAAAPMVLLWNFGIEALPYSYLAGWIAMLLVETPLMLRIYRKK